MIIYKITNKVNGKVYIGQTIHTLLHRKNRHLECVQSGTDSHLYNAMRKYGVENFVFEEIDSADTIDDLNYLESYYITQYDSVRTGYNMCYGGDNNVMFSDIVAKKHKAKMQSVETRAKLSATMKKKIADGKFFTPEHRARLSESAMGNHNFGDKSYDQSIACYCVDEYGEEHHFHSYLDAGKWWYENYKPFPYSACTYQRKIKQSIRDGVCTYGRGATQERFYIPVWYREESDANEEVTN